MSTFLSIYLRKPDSRAMNEPPLIAYKNPPHIPTVGTELSISRSMLPGELPVRSIECVVRSVKWFIHDHSIDHATIAIAVEVERL